MNLLGEHVRVDVDDRHRASSLDVARLGRRAGIDRPVARTVSTGCLRRSRHDQAAGAGAPGRSGARPRPALAAFDRLHPVLVGLVAAAIGADWSSTLSSLITCAVGLRLLLSAVPRRRAFRHDRRQLPGDLCLHVRVLPRRQLPRRAARLRCWARWRCRCSGFLAGCFLRRRQVFSIIHARRIRELRSSAAR